MRSPGETSTEISLPSLTRSREWLTVPMVECDRCHQLVERTSPRQRHCRDCRDVIKREPAGSQPSAGPIVRTTFEQRDAPYQEASISNLPANYSSLIRARGRL